MSLSVEGSLETDGDNFVRRLPREDHVTDSNLSLGGGSGGTILVFMHFLNLGVSGALSSAGGHVNVGGGGGGGGGRIHFHWSNIPTGDMYQPVATVNGSICTGLVKVFRLHVLWCLSLLSGPSVSFVEYNFSHDLGW